MAERRTLNVNGRSRTITVDDPDMPLLLALRENLNLNGPLFGCGLAQCGACTVHVDGKAVRSCVHPLSKVSPAQKVVTIEGLAQGNRLHPVQRAFVEEQAVQCGYCINGMIMESVAFLAGNKKIPRKRTSGRRSPTTSVAAAPTPASCARSSAPPAQREGGSHDPAFQSFTARSAQGRRRINRQLLAQRPRETALAQEAAAQRPLSIAEVDAFLAIDARGRVTVYSGKVDLGTGVRTALAQMAAEELDVPFNTVRIVEGDTALTPDQGKTWGSLTIQAGGVQIRNAAATARAALIEQAAQRLKAKPEELSVTNGVISAGNRRVTYGELIGGKMFSIKLDHAKPAKSKDPKDYRIVGKSIPRVDIPAKVTGRFTYINNLRVRGMLHGRVIRPPSVGARLESVDEGSIKDIAGIVRVVREGNFLGVVAQTEWGAIKATRQLKATWSKWEGLPEQAKLFEHVRTSKVFRDETTGNVGNTAEAMSKEGVKKVAATYDFAIHTHGSQVRPARWRNSATASSPHGRPRRRPTICASNSPRCSRCRSRTCAASISRARAVTAATATRTRPPTPPCSPRRSAVRCGCSGRAPTSMAGIRKARPRSSIFARRSTVPA